VFRNLLIALLVGLIALILIDRSRQSPHPAPVVVATPVAAPMAAPPAVPPPVVAESPAASLFQASAETPTLDMLDRLATRRRIVREGSRVYLDSLLLHTDSVLARWSERTTLNVTLVADSTVPGWSDGLLAEARAAMHAWDSDDGHPLLREVAPGDSADVTVSWVDVLPDSGQVGNTALHWTADGVAHSATILLALRRNPDSLVVPASARARIAIHEFGHALGLPHSDSPDDIMFRNSPVAMPSPRDQATLRLLYVLYPGPLRVQP
jgi:hypothetical protein